VVVDIPASFVDRRPAPDASTVGATTDAAARASDAGFGCGIGPPRRARGQRRPAAPPTTAVHSPQPVAADAWVRAAMVLA